MAKLLLVEDNAMNRDMLSRRLSKRGYEVSMAVDGQEGIDGADVFEPSMPLQEQHAVDFIIETLMAAQDDSITLVPTAPLTNIASAFLKEPKIAAKIHEIVLMGGALREGGNVPPSGEFNVYVDPQAAKIVFGCGRPIVTMGLDVTHQVLVTPQRIQAIRDLGTKVARNVQGMFEFASRYDIEKYGAEGGPLHDPCTVAYLLQPSLFQTKHVNIEVETESELTIGETVVDFWGVTGREPNVEWAHTVDADGFFELLTARIADLG